MKALTAFALDVAPVGVGSTKTMVQQDQGGLFLLDTATGSVVTLPKSIGDGGVYSFMVSTLATTNSHIVKVANTNDVIQGVIVCGGTAGAGTVWVSNATSDTITLNRTTTGSVTLGEHLVIVDASSGFFLVRGMTSTSGTGATPFSATV